MGAKVYERRRRSEAGYTIFEVLAVIGIISILAGIAIPQVLGARRILRSAGITYELTNGLRDARQMALSRRRAITFQYDNSTKQVKIIDHGINSQGLGISGIIVLTDGNYPNTTGSSVANTTSLTSGGIPATEIAYGPPPGASTQASTLNDKTTLATLANQKLNITFQPDGTIIGTNGAPSDVAFAIYNSVQPQETAAAVSILGATGRIKAWRYSDSVKKFVE